MASKIGDGNTTLFWRDRWLHGHRIEELAPHIFTMIPKRTTNRRTVADALLNSRWVHDLQGIFSWQVLQEFLLLSVVISSVTVQSGVPDRHFWRLSASGQYSAKSAYDATFQGSILFDAWERSWKTWAPPKCSFFLWLVAHNRCWTADRLAKRNLPHLSLYLLCEQEEENINHLLVKCVFARQFWFILLQRVGLATLAPQPSTSSFDEWWRQVSSSVSSTIQKGLNSLIILGAWTIWRHRNECVFNGKSPHLPTALVMVGDDLWRWNVAGARGLALLTAHDQEGP